MIPAEGGGLRQARATEAAKLNPQQRLLMMTAWGKREAAGGVAGLIKTVLCLEHGQVPPSLHVDTPTPTGAEFPSDTLSTHLIRQPGVAALAAGVQFRGVVGVEGTYRGHRFTVRAHS